MPKGESVLPPLRKLPSFERDLLRAAQFAYYVLAKPLFSDYEFDQMYEAYKKAHPNAKPLPVGSDLRESYSPAVRSLALYFLFRYNPPPPARVPTPQLESPRTEVVQPKTKIPAKSSPKRSFNL